MAVNSETVILEMNFKFGEVYFLFIFRKILPVITKVTILSTGRYCFHHNHVLTFTISVEMSFKVLNELSELVEESKLENRIKYPHVRGGRSGKEST